MASFIIAYKLGEKNEKGYTVDNGGPTYKGISWNAWKNNPTVQLIFRMVKAANPKKGTVINNPQLDKLIQIFFKTQYWDKIQGDKIENQEIANLVYDFAINSNSAAILINRALGVYENTIVTYDAVKVMNARPGFAYSAILQARRDLYNRLAATHPVFKKNGTYRGWVARLDRFNKNLNV